MYHYSALSGFDIYKISLALFLVNTLSEFFYINIYFTADIMYYRVNLIFLFYEVNPMSNIKRIGVLTSGGDAPGMNAAIRAVARSAA